MSESDVSNASSPQTYRRSGRIDFVRSLPWGLVLVGAIIGVSVIMTVLFEVGWYLIVFVPLFAAMAVAGAIVLLVDRGHWRNPWLAALTGFLAGATAYVAYFYIDMIWQVGDVSAAVRPDVFIDFLQFRMASDLPETFGFGYGPPSSGPREPTGVQPIFNWVLFWIELAFLALIPATTAWMRSNRAYCERCRQWMHQSTVGFHESAASAIQSLVESGDFRRIGAMPQAALVQGQPATLVMVSHCDIGKENVGDCPVYLSVKRARDGGAPPGNAARTTKGSAIRERRLSRTEVAELYSLFPGLKPFADKSLYSEISKSHEETRQVIASERKSEMGDDRIVVSEFPEETILTGANNLKAQLLIAVPLLYIFVGLGMLWLGLLLVEPYGELDVGSNIWPGCPLPIAILAIVMGVAASCHSLYYAVVRMTTLRDRFYRRKAAEVVERRSRAIVEPGSEGASFVEVIPREHWGKLMLESATDFGFFRLDASRHVLLFEGDHRRIVIPLGALRLLDFVSSAGPDGKTAGYLVLIEADDGATHLSLPMRAFEAKWRSSKKYRLGAAASLHNEIAAAFQPETPPVDPAAST